MEHSVYPYRLKKTCMQSLNQILLKLVILCSANTAATYKLADISLEQDAIFDKRYAITIDELYDGVSLTSYT